MASLNRRDLVPKNIKPTMNSLMASNRNHRTKEKSISILAVTGRINADFQSGDTIQAMKRITMRKWVTRGAIYEKKTKIITQSVKRLIIVRLMVAEHRKR